jgi:hypothetical protein
MVVSWATGVQNDVEMQMASATMKGFGSAWPSKEGERVKLTVQFAPGDQRLDVEVPVFKQEPK